MSLSKEFGILLHELRTEKGLSQDQLAELCGLDRSYISMLERGIRQPTLSSLFSIAQNLGLPPSEIVKRLEAIL